MSKIKASSSTFWTVAFYLASLRKFESPVHLKIHFFVSHREVFLHSTCIVTKYLHFKMWSFDVWFWEGAEENNVVVPDEWQKTQILWIILTLFLLLWVFQIKSPKWESSPFYQIIWLSGIWREKSCRSLGARLVQMNDSFGVY